MVATIHRLIDFETSTKKEDYKVDRTPYIKKYEKANEPFFICLRPKGFNKHLLLSTLFFYYSEKLAKTSRKLFRNLYISQFEPVSRSSFSVFYLDFSSIDPNKSDFLEIGYKTAIEYAIEEYCHFESATLPSHSHINPIQPLRDFLNSCGHEKLFVLINEYDGFHYEVLDPEVNQFESKRFGKNPLIVELYAELKQAVNSKRVGRVFIVGTDDSQDR